MRPPHALEFSQCFFDFDDASLLFFPGLLLSGGGYAGRTGMGTPPLRRGDGAPLGAGIALAGMMKRDIRVTVVYHSVDGIFNANL